MLRAKENATPSASIRRTTAPTRSGAPSGATICNRTLGPFGTERPPYRRPWATRGWPTCQPFG